MTVAKLLADLEPLTHASRISRMFSLGRDLGDGSPETLDSLSTGGPFARSMALWGRAGARDGSAIAAAATDPSRMVRNLAFYFAPLVCDDSHLGQLLALPNARKRRLMVRMLKLGRRAPIDAYVDSAATAEERGWTALLPLASAAVVARYAGRFSDSAAAEHWARLARFHPRLAADLLAHRAAETQGFDRRLKGHVWSTLPVLSVTDPDAAEALVAALSRTMPLGTLPMNELATRRPDGVAERVLSADITASPTFSLPAHRLSPELLHRWLDRAPGRGLGRPEQWLRRLPREQRGEAYRRCRLVWQDADGLLSPEIVIALPETERHAEARRHIALPMLSARPAQRFAYAALLPWKEARAAVSDSVRDSDADVRGRAIAALIATARFEPGHLVDAVAEVIARRFEQDPVRLQMMTAIAGLPPRHWSADHLTELATVIRHAREASDASPGTLAAVERLLVRLVPVYPTWAASQWAELATARGSITAPDIRSRLNDADVRQISPVLAPVIRSWQTRELEPQIIHAARLFGRRLAAFEALSDAVEQVVINSANDHLCESAVNLLAEHLPARFTRLVPKLMETDATWGTRATVRNYLLRSRQDLIGPCLGRVAYTGRFGTGKTRFYLPNQDGLWRMTPIQQQLLASTLREVTGDPKRAVRNGLAAVRQLAAMPDVPPVTLIQLAGDDARPALRDATLRALGSLDGPDGVPTLLAALADARARVAIYALRAALLQMPPDQALPLLRAAPFDKVTVAKEVVRLIGDLRNDAAFTALEEIDRRDGLHRDIRAAVVRAAWAFLSRPAAWDLIDRAVATGDPNMADPAGRVPVDGLSVDGRARLVRVLATLLLHVDPRVRIRTLGRLRDLPVDDPGKRLLDPLLQAVGSIVADERRAASVAVFATYAGRSAESMAAVVSGLLTNRRALADLIDALTTAVRGSGDPALLSTGRAVIAALAVDPVTAAMRTRLAVTALAADEFVAVLTGFPIHASVITTACEGMTAATAARGTAHAEAVEQALTGSPDEGLRRVALAALIASATNNGWNSERRERLLAFQNDPSPLVAGVAQFTFPPENELTIPAQLSE